MYYSKEEINKMIALSNEGKTYYQIMEELYPKSEIQCLYERLEESRTSFSLIGAIYNFFAKKSTPLSQHSCTECIEC